MVGVLNCLIVHNINTQNTPEYLNSTVISLGKEKEQNMYMSWENGRYNEELQTEELRFTVCEICLASTCFEPTDGAQYVSKY